MWKRMAIYLSIMLTLILGAGSIAYFIWFREPSYISVKAEQEYYFEYLRRGLLRRSDAYGAAMSGVENVIELQQTNDQSYGMFEKGFKVFRLHFSGHPNDDMVFIITKFKQSRGKVDATIEHIYDNKLYKYKLSSTKELLVVTGTVDYEIKVASPEFGPEEVKQILRAGTPVMHFVRPEAIKP